MAEGEAGMSRRCFPLADVLSSFGDAFDFIVSPQPSSFAAGGGEVGGPDEVLDKLVEHLKVSGAAFAVAVVVALPVGGLAGPPRAAARGSRSRSATPAGRSPSWR